MNDSVLSVNNLVKKFAMLTATDDVCLDLKPGEIHAIIGPNGAGKSTLIKQICGELVPDSGTITMLGQDITALDVASRACLGLGRTFQISSLIMEYTALRNVMLALQSMAGHNYRFFQAITRDYKLREEAFVYLEQVGLANRADITTAELSHGERRQLEIAIALALKPKAFLLDEPMAGMGLEGSKHLTVLLDKLRHQAPILMVEHDMDAVFSLADRISVLVYGKVLMTGTVAEVKANAQVQEAYLGKE